jgi:exonuclease SbcC
LHPSLVLLQRSFERLHVGSKSAFDWHGIDEGFGSLDADALDLAVDALEALQERDRQVGVIIHVAAMIERIAVQVCLEKCGAGRSEIRVSAGMGLVWPAVDAVQ